MFNRLSISSLPGLRQDWVSEVKSKKWTFFPRYDSHSVFLSHFAAGESSVSSQSGLTRVSKGIKDLGALFPSDCENIGRNAG